MTILTVNGAEVSTDAPGDTPCCGSCVMSWA
jgi:hypothetical protein